MKTKRIIIHSSRYLSFHYSSRKLLIVYLVEFFHDFQIIQPKIYSQRPDSGPCRCGNMPIKSPGAITTNGATPRRSPEAVEAALAALLLKVFLSDLHSYGTRLI
jgi:hypothetical protein